MRGGSDEHIPISELNEILRSILEKKDDIQVRKDIDSIVIEKGNKSFQINEDGTIQGSMPLHSFHTHSATSLTIGSEDIEVHYENGTHVFFI